MQSTTERIDHQVAAAAPAADPVSAEPARLRRAWNAAVGAIATLVGLAPHVLHHIGLLAGVAVVAGTRGTIAFGVIGLLASLPLFIRLRRRFNTWRAPAIALVIFVLLFSLSSFVIGPAISGDGSGGGSTPAGHEQHHTG